MCWHAVVADETLVVKEHQEAYLVNSIYECVRGDMRKSARHIWVV